MKIDHTFNEGTRSRPLCAREQDHALRPREWWPPAFSLIPLLCGHHPLAAQLAVNYRWGPHADDRERAGCRVQPVHLGFLNPDPNASTTRRSSSTSRRTAQSRGDAKNARRITTYQLVDNLSHQRGAHTLKFGTNVRIQKHRRRPHLGRQSSDCAYRETGNGQQCSAALVRSRAPCRPAN